MWPCFVQLQSHLQSLRHYIDGLARLDRIVSFDYSYIQDGEGKTLISDVQNHFRSSNNKSLYDYTTVIVSLYGYLERYIEGLIGEYIDCVMGLSSRFEDLPEPIRTKHLDLSLELSRKVNQQRYLGSVRLEDIVANLHACYRTPTTYKLNSLAFAQHSANFRHDVVTNTFPQCGIQGVAQAIRQVEPFTSFLEREDSERDVQGYLANDDTIVFFRLDDLASRRNDVAHGSPVDEVLSNDLLRTYVDFVEAYAEGLAVVVYEESLPLMCKQATALGSPIRIYNDHIVCVNLFEGQIAVGDILIAKTNQSSRPFKGGPIKSIERNHVPRESVEGGSDVQIGLRVEFHAKHNHQFYYFRKTE